MNESKIKKLLYIIVRESSLFSLPLLRKARNSVYSWYLDAVNVNVDSRVHIAKSHRNPSAYIDIGPNLNVGLDAKIDLTGGMVIGKNVTISEGAKVYTHDHNIDGPNEDWREDDIRFSSLQIGDYAWIGANAIITASVAEIGKGAVVAAGSVLTRDVEPFAVVAGVPARHIRYRKAYSKGSQ
jgi:acetyltransferase-like isoleucine patch superfamily enzyme